MEKITPTIDAITRLLFIETKITKADIIIVLGNNWLPTMNEVARIYFDGISDRILITGHSADKESEVSEARRFMEKGLDLHIPEEAFLLEEKATNTKENIAFSAQLIDEKIGLQNINNVLFVVKTFHARRVFMTARSHFPPEVNFMFHSICDERHILQNNWWKNPVAKERILAELGRLSEYALNSDISIE